MSDFEIAPGVGAGAAVRAYECKPGDPHARPLKVFTVDPSVTRADGAIATVDVPYEPLQPGPIGALFEVECADGDVRFAPLDLESPRILINNGLTPSVPNPAFHQQMVYAVASRAYATFRKALGRLIAWGQDEDGVEQGPALRLTLRPHVKSEGANAVYDKTRREIRFGYIPDPQLPNGRIFACLSHDIIVHEMTHALIDGLRSRFTIPTSADVLGFHEGLADLAAVFHHFLYEDVLAAQIRQVGPKVDQSPMLTRIAANFGLAAIGPAGVRVAVDEHVRYRRDLEAHEMGSVLVTAVFEAFVIMFRRKTERYLRLAGPQPPGFWSEDLVQLLAAKAAELARNFLDIGIRAIDYCPPLDVQLGEYLRAVITADASLVADDPWGYRETLIACFARRGIIPEGVSHLSEEALLWRPPSRPLPPIPQLSFADLRFNGDPSMPASAGELERQARALGAFVTQRQHCAEFGLMPVDVAAGVDPARVQSIRTARRVGPDGQVLFDLVAEVTQRRTVTDPQTGARVKFFGGSTILIGPHGEVRLVISKNIRRQERLDRQLAFQRDSSFWTMKDGRYLLSGEALPIAHAQGRACGLLSRSPLS